MRNTDYNEKYFQAHPERKLRAQDQMRFCLELEEQYWSGCRAVMRKAGIKVPVEATNWQGHGLATRVHMLGQSKLDYIDRHGYWDHPEGEGNLKWRIATARFHDLPMVKAVKADQDRLFYLGVGNLVTEKAWEQVLGLPMTISEWNTCLPNEYSLEGTGLMAAYGLLQGWDASLQFGYFSPDWPKALSGGSFDLLGNPPQILQFPAASVMWLRQDVKEADLVAESIYDPESVFALTEDRKPLPIAAALVGKVGYRFVEKNRPPVAKDISSYWDAKNLVAHSITGELTWDANEGICPDQHAPHPGRHRVSVHRATLPQHIHDHQRDSLRRGLGHGHGRRCPDSNGPAFVDHRRRSSPEHRHGVRDHHATVTTGRSAPAPESRGRRARSPGSGDWRHPDSV